MRTKHCLVITYLYFTVVACCFATTVLSAARIALELLCYTDINDMHQRRFAQKHTVLLYKL